MNVGQMMNRASATMLRRLDPEIAHDVAIKAMAFGLVPRARPVADPRLAVELLGLSFPNPIGLAAGFDKNGEAADTLLSLGFGFVEVGTVTPHAQPGNPKPRLFRLPEVQGVINRFGFNSEGHERMAARLRKRAGRPGIVGVNIGANKDSADKVADFVAGVRQLGPLASYLAVNVSSPNTPGLRDLQARDALDDLLARVMDARNALPGTGGPVVPVLLKISPDVTEEGLDDICAVAAARQVDGMIVSNTTLSRTGIAGPLAAEAGGLSGRPLFERSTIMLAKTRQRVGPTLPVVGVGGIATADDAFEKIAAGADVVQVYTAFIYADADLAPSIAEGLIARLAREGLPSITAAKGLRTADWAARSIPA